MDTVPGGAYYWSPRSALEAVLLPLLRPTALRRLLRPHRGALANARDGVRLLDTAAAERHELSVVQAQALGVDSWRPLRAVSPRHQHGLQQSVDDGGQTARLTAYVVEGLADGQVCVVALTAQHRRALLQRLYLAGLSEAAARRLVAVDAHDELEAVVRDGRPDPELFESHVGARLRTRVRLGQRPRVAGETGALLLSRGDVAGTLALERLWDGLQRELGFPLLCTYPDQICPPVVGAHSHEVVPV